MKNKSNLPALLRNPAILSLLINIVGLCLFCVDIVMHLVNREPIGVIQIASGIGLIFALTVTICLWLPSIKESPLATKAIHLLGRPRFSAIVIILLAEMILGMVALAVRMNLRLFIPAYFGILPALLMGLYYTLLFLISLARKSFKTSGLLFRICRLTLQESLLLAVILIGSFAAGSWITREYLLPGLAKTLFFTEHLLYLKLLELTLAVFLMDLFLFGFSFLNPNSRTLQKLFSVSDSSPTFSQQSTSLPILGSLLFALLLVGGFLLFLRIGYDTNDDIFMVQILSGFYADTTVPFPVFSNVLLGFLYQHFFNLNSSINWVVLFYLFCSLFAIWNLFYSIFKLSIKLLTKIFFFLVTSVFISYFLSNITYTTIATLCCISGLASILDLIDPSKKVNPIRMIASILLILAGSMIRIESTILSVLLIIPIVLFNLDRYFTRKALMLFFWTVGLVLCCQLVNTFIIQKSPAWESYYQYNSLHRQIRDTPRTKNLARQEDLLSSVGWSENDIAMFHHWFALDKEVFSESTLNKIVANTSNWNSDFSQTLSSFRDVIGVSPPIRFLALVFTCWISVVLVTQDRRILLISTVILILLLIVNFLLVWGFKDPYRVSISSMFCATVAFCFLPGLMQQPNKHPLSANFAIAGILSILFLVGSAWYLFARPFMITSAYQRQQDRYEQYLNEIDTLKEEGVFSDNTLIFSAGDGFPFSAMDPLTLQYPSVDILYLSWNKFSPLFYKVLEQHNIPPSPQTYVNHPDVFILSLPDLIPNVVTFYKEHYDLDITCQIVYTLGQSQPEEMSDNAWVVYALEQVALVK